MSVEPEDGVSAEMRELATMWANETLRQFDTRTEFSSRHGATVATVPLSRTPPTDIDSLDSLLDSAEGIPWERLGL
jgi:hypothetical protein